MYESKCSTYILSLEDFINYTIIDVVQDVEDPIAVDRIKTNYWNKNKATWSAFVLFFTLSSINYSNVYLRIIHLYLQKLKLFFELVILK